MRCVRLVEISRLNSGRGSTEPNREHVRQERDRWIEDLTNGRSFGGQGSLFLEPFVNILVQHDTQKEGI